MRFESIKRTTLTIRRYGVPHEESVILPALALAFFLRRYEVGTISVQFAALASAAITSTCGCWLGLAWKGFPSLKVLLRKIYFSTISAFLISLGHPDATRVELIATFGQVEETLGLMFYLAWFTGSSARNIILDIYPSPELREKAKQRRERIGLWFRLASEEVDEKSANPRDRMIGRAIRNVMTNPGQLVACVGAIVAVATLLFQVVRWLLKPI